MLLSISVLLTGSREAFSRLPGPAFSIPAITALKLEVVSSSPSAFTTYCPLIFLPYLHGSWLKIVSLISTASSRDIPSKLSFSSIHITLFSNLVHFLARHSFLSNGPYHNENYEFFTPKSKGIHLVNAGLGR